MLRESRGLERVNKRSDRLAAGRRYRLFTPTLAFLNRCIRLRFGSLANGWMGFGRRIDSTLSESWTAR